MGKTFYSLTYLDLQNEAVHAIGGTPDPNAPLSHVINGAMEYLYNCHPWSWREQITTLDFQAGVGQIPLPIDFAELIDLVGFQARYTAVKPAAFKDIARVRVYGLPDQHVMLYAVGDSGQYRVQNPIVAPNAAGALAGGGTLATGGYYIRQTWNADTGGETQSSPETLVQVSGTQNAIAWQVGAAPANATTSNLYIGTQVNQETLVSSAQAANATVNITALPAGGAAFWPQQNSTYDPTAIIGKVLETAPIPATAQGQALYLTYRRGAPMLVNNTDVPAVPYNFFDLLRTLVRAMAVSSTVQQGGHDWQVFNDQLPKYKAADTMGMGPPDRMIDCLDIDDGLYALRPWMAIKTPYDP